MYPIEKYNYVTYDQKNKDGSITKVIVAMSTYCGKLVKGVAKCMATDSYDLEVGKRLAAARCDFKVCEKRKKRAAKKYHDVSEKLERLSDYVRRMGNYYSDANYECVEAMLRLTELEKQLG